MKYPVSGRMVFKSPSNRPVSPLRRATYHILASASHSMTTSMGWSAGMTASIDGSAWMKGTEMSVHPEETLNSTEESAIRLETVTINVAPSTSPSATIRVRIFIQFSPAVFG